MRTAAYYVGPGTRLRRCR